VAEQLSAELGRPCDVEEAATVARRTGGNPLFVREIGRLRRFDPKASITDVPTGARDAIRQYLTVLSPSCRALLSTASVLSVDIDPVMLAAVASASVEDVLDALGEAVAASVVAQNQFTHDLVRDSLMLDVTPAERGRIHLRAAEYLDSGSGHIAQIAHHRLAALPLGSLAAARQAAVRAAELAMSQLAYEDAVRLYDQALAGTPDLDLLIGKATAQYLAYDVEPARRTCEEAANLARRAGDAVGLARAALVMPDQADPNWLGTILPWCDEALAGLPPGDGILRAKLLALRATTHTALGETADAHRLSDMCLAMAERLDDAVTLVAALRARQHANSGPDGNHERLALGDRMLRLGDSAAMWGHLWRFDAFMQLGRVVDADLELDLLEPVVARLDSPLAHWHLHRSRAAILQGRGRFADANRALDQARRLAELGNNPYGVVATELSRAFNNAVTSSSVSSETAAVLRRGFGPSPLSRIALATMYVAVEDFDRAREIYRTLPPLASLTLPAWYQLSTRSQYARITAALGDADAAAVAYDQLLPHAHLHLTTGAGVTRTAGSVHYCLGLTATVCGRVDAAVDHLRTAIAVNDSAGLDPFAAEARYRLAVLVHDRAEAEAAHAAAVRLGMPRLRAHTESLLDELG
jgi:tetratricopeptide (TPR) repeat protein